VFKYCDVDRRVIFVSQGLCVLPAREMLSYAESRKHSLVSSFVSILMHICCF